MKRLSTLVVGILFVYAPALAKPAFHELLSLAEFKQLAAQLAPKVNLFCDAWAIDPKAEFYGGTTRDYLYWLKGQFQNARSRSEALKIAEDLRKKNFIDVRDFIIGDSDVDIVSNVSFKLDPRHYGVKKIDSIDGDRFDRKTAAGKNELDQGYIPVEKIRLSKEGFVDWEGVGDGIAEIRALP